MPELSADVLRETDDRPNKALREKTGQMTEISNCGCGFVLLYLCKSCVPDILRASLCVLVIGSI